MNLHFLLPTDQNLEPGAHSLSIFASTPGGQVQEIGLGIIVPGEG